MVSLRRSQIAAISATIVDFGSLIFLVEICRVWYVAATAVSTSLLLGLGLIASVFRQPPEGTPTGEPPHEITS